MKLISCHVINFGTISDFDYTFYEGINSFVKNNGEGKSTFASFIKAMLYGMDTVAVNDKVLKDRAHYAPFNNKKFGGSLDFEHNDKTFHIERTFDVKTYTQDTFKLYIDGRRTYQKPEFLSLILKLDKETFDKLVFISSNDIEISSTSNIKQSLNSIIDKNIEGVNYDKLIQNIDENKKKYSKSGRKSETLELIKEKNDLETSIENLKTIRKNLEEQYVKYSNLTRTLTSLEKEQEAYNNSIAIKENFKTLKEKEDKLNALQEELKVQKEKFKNDIPSEEDIKELKTLFNDKQNLFTALNYKKASFDKIERLNELKLIFKNGVPLKEDIEELYNLNNELTQIEASIISNKNLANNFEENKFIVFNESKISKEKLEEAKKDIERYEALKKSLEENIKLTQKEEDIFKRYKDKEVNVFKEKIEQQIEKYKIKEESLNNVNLNSIKENKPKKKRNILGIISLIITILFTCLGIGLIFINQIVGIIFTLIGILGLVTSLFLMLRKEILSINNISHNTNEDYETTRREVMTLAEGLQNYFNFFDINLGSQYSNYERFKLEVETFNDIESRYKNDKLDKDKYLNEFTSLENNLTELFKPFELTGSFNDKWFTLNNLFLEYQNEINNEKNRNLRLNELIRKQKDIKDKISSKLSLYDLTYSNDFRFDEFKSLVNEFNTLTKDLDDLKKGEEEINDEILNKDIKIKNIEAKYAINPITSQEKLDDLINLVNDISLKNSQVSEEIKDIKLFKENKNLNDVDEKILDLVDKSGELVKLKSELTRLNEEIDINENSVESLSEEEEKLEIINQKIKDNEHRLELLINLKSLFEEAQRKLDDKYVKPIFDKFKEYLEKLGKISEYEFKMNRDFSLDLIVDGTYKSDMHLSSGQRTLCTLCFRIAMLDSIFNSKAPFIIMDDPFMTLDSHNFEVVIRLLKEISKDKQIIYLTCHRSRELNIDDE